MYSKDMIIGILLCSKPVLHITVDERNDIGYSSKLRLYLRGEEEFCKALERSLLQHGITSTYKERESKARPKPVLFIGGIKNHYIINKMVNPLLPSIKNEWKEYTKAYNIMANKKHLTLEGLEELIEIKRGLADGLNKHKQR